MKCTRTAVEVLSIAAGDCPRNGGSGLTKPDVKHRSASRALSASSEEGSEALKKFSSAGSQVLIALQVRLEWKPALLRLREQPVAPLPAALRDQTAIG